MPDSQLNLRNKSVLLLDRNPQTRKVLYDLLRAIGVGQVIAAKSAADALEMLQTLVFHVVLCNWAAPLEAPAFIRRLRASQDDAIKRVPIIVTRQGATRPEVTDARDAGMTEFLAPPLSAAVLKLKFEHVFLKPRTFVEAASYRGPDRRRRTEDSTKEHRRESDPHAPECETQKDAPPGDGETVAV